MQQLAFRLLLRPMWVKVHQIFVGSCQMFAGHVSLCRYGQLLTSLKHGDGRERARLANLDCVLMPVVGVTIVLVNGDIL